MDWFKGLPFMGKLIVVGIAIFVIVVVFLQIPGVGG